MSITEFFWTESPFSCRLVLCQVRFAGNFGAKARIIDDRKLVRIGLILTNLRSLRSIDSTELSRSKLSPKTNLTEH